MGNTIRITDALRQIATQTANSFQAEICVICLSSNGRIAEKLAYGGENASAWLERQDLYEFLLTATGEKPLCFQSLDIDKKAPASLVSFLRAQRIHAFVAMPMLFEGVSLGTLSLFFASLKDFSDTELRHLSVAANTVAAALHTGEDETQPRFRYGNVFENIVGKSVAMRQVFEVMQKAAPTDTNLLIYGESGTGKELIARGIHNLSQRKKHAFIAVDCVALPSNLLESELFGFEKGAFTGAVDRKNGLFEFADKGTFFMDEIGELDPALQAKLLRVLQERQFRRVGGQSLISVDIRVISATNRDPETAVRDKILREDLYYRLNVIPICVPALRERKEDIPLLVSYFLNKFTKANGLHPREFHSATIQALQNYHWPGNIRELQNVIKRVVSLCKDDTILPEDLPSYITPLRSTAALPAPDLLDSWKTWKEYHDTMKYTYFKTLLEKTNGDLSEVARKANVTLRTVYHVMHDYDLRADSN
jgi:transcriptional regulator with PAS, ATPase and Fis domain